MTETIDINYNNKKYSLKLKNKLNSGSFGTVFDCDTKIDNKFDIVIKKSETCPTWFPGKPSKPFYYDQVLNDDNIPNYFNGVVRYFDIVYHNGYYYSVMEKLDYTLDEYTCINAGNVYNVLHQLIRNIQQIHECGYVILDIKPENIMIKNNKAYFIDLDITLDYSKLSTYEKDTEIMLTPIFSSIYTLLNEPVFPIDNLISIISVGLYVLNELEWNIPDDVLYSCKHDLSTVAYYISRTLVKWSNDIENTIGKQNGKPANNGSNVEIDKQTFKKNWSLFVNPKNKDISILRYMYVYLYMISRKGPETFIDYDFLLDVLDNIQNKKLENKDCKKINPNAYAKNKITCSPNVQKIKKNIDKIVQFESSKPWSCSISIRLVRGIVSKLLKLKKLAKQLNIDNKIIEKIDITIKKAPKCRNKNNFLWNYLIAYDYIDLAEQVYKKSKDNDKVKDILLDFINIYNSFN